jgi:hypothetical protein
MKKPTVAITQRALMARVNRKLAHEGQILKVSRSAAEKQNFGGYFVIDEGGNVSAHGIDDLAAWVRAEFPDMLKPFENLEG